MWFNVLENEGGIDDTLWDDDFSWTEELDDIDSGKFDLSDDITPPSDKKPTPDDVTPPSSKDDKWEDKNSKGKEFNFKAQRESINTKWEEKFKKFSEEKEKEIEFLKNYDPNKDEDGSAKLDFQLKGKLAEQDKIFAERMEEHEQKIAKMEHERLIAENIKAVINLESENMSNLWLSLDESKVQQVFENFSNPEIKLSSDIIWILSNIDEVKRILRENTQKLNKPWSWEKVINTTTWNGSYDEIFNNAWWS